VDREQLNDWVEGYVRAWESNRPEDIGDLFTDDARYFTAPHRPPWTGREGIIEEWLDRKDEPGDWSFRWEIRAVCDDMGFVRGWTSYPQEGHDYSNLWEITLDDDGRCSEFVEWFMDIPAKT
jgi:hypothetical protein